MSRRRALARRRRRNPSGTLVEIAAVAGGGFLGSWAGYFAGTALSGSKVSGAPFGYVGALLGATIGHFVVR